MNVDHWEIKSELERKCMEFAVQLESQLERGDISAQAFKVGLSTINGITRGLIDSDINEAADDMLLAAAEVTWDRRVFQSKSGSIVTLGRAWGDDKVTIGTDMPGLKSGERGFNDADDPVKASWEFVVEQTAKLIAKGFTRLA